jgi:anaerobic ribonucleoside-triphosphate reductase
MKNLECKCKHCGSGNVDLVTRIVGYFSKISFWNKSKLEELNSRQKGNYKI